MRVKIKKNPNEGIRTLETLAKRFKKSKGVKAGLPSDSNAYPDGTSVIVVGIVHEFGNEQRGIPERSFLRSALRENRDKYYNLAKTLNKRIIRGEINAEQAHRILGLQLQNDIRDKITDLKDPPLKHRVGGNPLRDTSHMIRSVTYVVDQ